MVWLLSPLCPHLFPLAPLPLSSSHTSLCWSMKTLTLLLPQDLCPVVPSACTPPPPPHIATGPTTLVSQVCSQMFSRASPLTTQCENTALPQMLPVPFPGFIYFFCLNVTYCIIYPFILFLV